MAPLHFPNPKVLFLLLLFTISFVSSSTTLQPSIQLVGNRHLLEKKQDSDSDGIQTPPLKKKKLSTTPNALSTTLSSTKNKNTTKLFTPTTTNKNSTKINKLQEKTTIKLKLNSTSNSKPTSKNSNSTKPTSKTSNPTKPISKTSNSTKPISKTSNPTKPTSLLTQKSTDPTKKTPIVKKDLKKEVVKKSTKPVNGLTYQDSDDDSDDLVSEFRDLPSRFQETLLPDLEVLSTTSKAYLTKANKQISKNFNPIVGKKYAPIIASIISFTFILIPFLLVSLIFNKIKAYFSLQKLIIFIQIYLSIYFSILSLSSIVTGLEPLKFFYATSQSTYICIQLLQTLAYVMYLLVLLMYLVFVFSTESGVVSKVLGVGQTFVGCTVGIHYYVTVFHRAVLRQAPKTSWKVHGVYATCFLLICLLGTAERRKKAYVVDGSEEGKKS